MTTRSDVDRLARASRRVVGLARADLAQYFAALPLDSPELVRDALLEVVPALVREYGDIAATAAAEWYEEVRASSVSGMHYARLGATATTDSTMSAVRFASGHLFGDNPQQTLVVLSGAIQRFITYSSRSTVAVNAAHDPQNPRFARVPTGAKTCAFCEMLASRGFVYYSEEAAGAFDEWHNDCDCQIVPEWDKDAHHIKGYDPDAMYGRYEAAREAAGGYGADASEIAYEMRRLFPDQYTDGVHSED